MAQFSFRSGPSELQQEGPRVRIIISAPREEIDEGRAVGLDYPDPISVVALVDTGASLTVINPELAQSYRLRQTGFAKVSAVGSLGDYPRYAACIKFVGNNLKGFEIIPVVGCKLPQQSISCLIGRDLMRRWKFTYDGRTGEFTITD